jgi:hypothetical protein
MEFDCATNPQKCATNPTYLRPKWSLTAPTFKGIAQMFDY